MTTRPQLPAKGMLIYFLLCVLGMVWPGALIANRIEPMVMGLPFFMFWYIACVFAMFIGLVICYLRDERQSRAEEASDE